MEAGGDVLQAGELHFQVVKMPKIQRIKKLSAQSTGESGGRSSLSFTQR